MEELRCLLDTPGLRVSYDEANGWLYNQLLGVYDVALVREHAAAICSCHRAWPCRKILSDHSGLVGSWQHSVAWVGAEYLGTLAAQGVVCFAWVYNKNYQDHVAMEQTLYAITRPIVAIFDNLASACEWLQHCPAAAAIRQPEGQAATLPRAGFGP